MEWLAEVLALPRIFWDLHYYSLNLNLTQDLEM